MGRTWRGRGRALGRRLGFFGGPIRDEEGNHMDFVVCDVCGEEFDIDDDENVHEFTGLCPDCYAVEVEDVDEDEEG